MAVFERLRDIIEANINSLLDRAEDPVKMAEQYLLKYRENLAKARVNTAKVMAEQDKLEERIRAKEGEQSKRETQAKNALLSGDERAARLAVEEKQRVEADLVKLRETHETFAEQVRVLQDDYNSLANAIRDLENKRDMIKAKSAVNQAQKAAQGTLASTKGMSSVKDKLDRIEDKVDSQLNVNRAMKKLDAGTDELADLEKYSGGSSVTADAEIDRLKAELGLK